MKLSLLADYSLQGQIWLTSRVQKNRVELIENRGYCGKTSGNRSTAVRLRKLSRCGNGNDVGSKA